MVTQHLLAAFILNDKNVIFNLNLDALSSVSSVKYFQIFVKFEIFYIESTHVWV